MLRLARALPLVVAVVGCERVAGCEGEPRAAVEAPRRFDADGISFAYPGNWRVREETVQQGSVELRTIEVESEGDALVVIQRFEPAVAVDVDEHIEATTAAMQADLAARAGGGVVEGARGPVTRFERALLGAPRPARRAAITVAVLGERAPGALELVAAVLPERTVLVFTSVADADRPRAAPGFDMVLDSLALAE